MRKTKIAVIRAEGRDKGKQFVLTEMDADRAEKWGVRAMIALANAGVDMPIGAASQGMAGVARLLVTGIRALPGLRFAEVEPLMDEMWGCIQVIRDPAHPNLILPFLQSDTEEISTRLFLRMELLELHVGFSLSAVLQSLGQPTTDQTSPSPRTSQ